MLSITAKHWVATILSSDMGMSTDKRYSLFLYTGFGLLLIVFISLAVYHVKQIIVSNEVLSETITKNDIQLRAAMNMRVAVRERAILLWNMTFQEDSFEKDRLYQQFNNFGARFSNSRLEYLSIKQTIEEQKLFFTLNKETNKRAPELRIFADLLMDDSVDKFHFTKLDKALSEQIIVSAILDEIIQLQQAQNKQAHKETAKMIAEILSNLIVWVMVFIISVILFARKIVQVANRQGTALSNANRELNQLARNDHLTNLPNRLFLIEHLELTLSHAKRNRNRGALLYIDLDNFKPINDKYGHSMGDEYLKTISLAMKKLLRESDALIRLGGDEFVVVLYEISSEGDAINVTDKLLTTLSSEYKLNGITVSASASIGIRFFPEEGLTVDRLLSSADAAMYNAKQAGKNRYHIHQETNGSSHPLTL